jgi:integrase
MSLYRRESSPCWYCEFEYRDPITGQLERIRRSTDIEISDKTPTALERSKAAARQQEALLKQQYIEEREKEINGSGGKKIISFDAWATRFLENAEQQYKGKPNTIQFFRDRVASLRKYRPLKTAMLPHIDMDLIDGFKLWRAETTRTYGLRKAKGEKAETADTFRPVSVATVNRDLAVLRLMLNEARKRQYLVGDFKIELNIKAESERDRLITPKEERAYLAAAPQPLRDFAVIALNTGMRPKSEICVMQWENVDLRHGTIFNPKGKSKKARRTIPMIGPVKATLTRRHKDAGRPAAGYVFPGDGDEPISYWTIDSQHDRVMKELQWKVKARLYDMRHTALTRMHHSGMDVIELQRAAGHSSLTTTQRYIKDSQAHTREAFSRFEQFTKHMHKSVKKKAAAKTA